MKKKSFRCSFCSKEIEDLKKSFILSLSNTDDFLNPPVFRGSYSNSFLFCCNCYHSFLDKLKQFFNEVKNA